MQLHKDKKRNENVLIIREVEIILVDDKRVQLPTLALSISTDFLPVLCPPCLCLCICIRIGAPVQANPTEDPLE